MEELKKENDQGLMTKIVNVYSLSDLTSSDAGVSGECNNEVNIKCETKDFSDCSIELTDDISLLENIKQEPQSEDINLPSHKPQSLYTPYSHPSSEKKIEKLKRKYRIYDCTVSLERIDDLYFLNSDVRCVNKRKVTDESCSTSDNNRCPVCNKSFLTFDSLKRHVQQEHVDERQHDCTDVLMTLDSNQEIKEENEAESYINSLCEQSYSSVASLSQHSCVIYPSMCYSECIKTENSVENSNEGHSLSKFCIADNEKHIKLYQEPAKQHERQAELNSEMVQQNVKLKLQSVGKLRMKQVKQQHVELVKPHQEQVNRQEKHLELNQELLKQPEEKKRNLCDICGYSYNCEHELDLHNYKGNDNFLLNPNVSTCTYCNYRYIPKCSLKQYLVTDYDPVKPFYKCSKCDQKFSASKPRELHYRLVHGNDMCNITEQCNVYKCPECDEKFSASDNRDFHYRAVHWLEKPYTSECKSLSKTRIKRNVNRTKLKHEPAKHSEKQVKQRIKRVKPKQKQVKQQLELVKHCEEKMKPNQEQVKHQEQNIELNQELLKQPTEKKHKCDICGFSSKCEHEKQMHNDKNNESFLYNPKTITCANCDNCLVPKCSLKQYLVIEHDPVTLFYKCSKCDKKFSSRKPRELHDSLVHNNEMRDITEQCNIYKCSACDKKFSTKNNLELHYRVLHGSEICNESEVSRNERIIHLVKDKYFSCGECGTVLPYRINLRDDHMLTVHNGEKAKECKFPGCTEFFLTWESLSKHVKTVHGKSRDTAGVNSLVPNELAKH